MSGVKIFQPVSVQYAAESAASHIDNHYVVAAKNQWSRIVLKFQDLAPDVWCEFSFQIDWHPSEESRAAHDFASLGFTFLSEDGSNIDFSYVPGLTRAQIDPYSAHIAGPTLHDRNANPSGSSRIHCSFLLPAPAKQLLVTIRSWRNSHPFQVGHPVLRQFVQTNSPGAIATKQALVPSHAERDAALRVRQNWKILRADPVWFSYTLVPGRRLFVRGQLITNDPRKDGAMVRVIFKSADGQVLPPPYPETLVAPEGGAYINIPTLTQARRFTLGLAPPPRAATVELGFQAWSEDTAVELILPLEISLDDDLLLENISGEDQPDAAHFMESVAERLKISSQNLAKLLLNRTALAGSPRIQERLRNVQVNESRSGSLDDLRLGGFPKWPVPEEPTWTEDPFRSPAWRLEFQSLFWLLDTGRDSNAVLSTRALDLALSWSRCNAWGQPADVLSVHPLSLAIRTEALTELLALALLPERKMSADKVIALAGEVLRHGFAVSEIVGQNVFAHSVYQLHAAGSLLALARALPMFPLSGFWASTAIARLRTGFDELIGPSGFLTEHSQHHRLEVVSLGLILCHYLERIEEGRSLRQHLLSRLKEALPSIIAVTDPTGALPAFGDAPHGYHHATWMRRLITQYGQGLAGDERIRSELSYPQGSRILAFPEAGVIAARSYDGSQKWAYFCTCASEQRDLQDHSDCTSFVFSSQGERWIIDPSGSSQHEAGAARHFLLSSKAHNIALPDGREQNAGAAWLRSATSVGNANVFELVSNVHGPDYIHRRVFVVLNDVQGLAVYDHFKTSKRPLSFDGFLHFEPELVAALVNPQLVLGYLGQKRLRIMPQAITGRFSGLEISQGRSEKPWSFQGFVSRRTGSLEPASVLRYTFTGHQSVCGGVVMAADEASLRAIVAIVESADVREIIEPDTASSQS